MSNITYRELAQYINDMLTEEQKDLDVSIYLTNTDEYFSCTGTSIQEETDILDKDHPYLTIDA